MILGPQLSIMFYVIKRNLAILKLFPNSIELDKVIAGTIGQNCNYLRKFMKYMGDCQIIFGI